MARNHSHYRKREAERRYPFRVDVPVPPVIGLGGRLNAMVEWCRDNFQPDAWENHGHLERKAGEIPVDFARFYFMEKADAELFRWKWFPTE
jgi:hypothetical protein